MGLSKEQVERHIAGVEKRLGSTQEVRTSTNTGLCSLPSVHSVTVLLCPPQRAHHGYEFARLCVEVKKYPEAIRYVVTPTQNAECDVMMSCPRYLTNYLTVQEKDFR